MTPKGVDVYPQVRSEFETLDAILAGKSISRFGDGEIKMLMGISHKYENFNPGLQSRLRNVLKYPHPDLIVAIPRIVPECPRAYWWEPWKYRMMPYLRHDVTYYSSFISRPDHAPWIAEDNLYSEALHGLWRGRRVVLVGSGKSLTVKSLVGAEVVQFIQTPERNAFETHFGLVRDAICFHKPDVAILCAGMMATVMPREFLGSGIQVLDLGAIGQNKLWDIAAAINRGDRKE